MVILQIRSLNGEHQGIIIGQWRARLISAVLTSPTTPCLIGRGVVPSWCSVDFEPVPSFRPVSHSPGGQSTRKLVWAVKLMRLAAYRGPL